MGVKDCINVTLKKNEVTIKIDIGAEHKNVIANLKKKLPELKKLYKEDKTPTAVLKSELLLELPHSQQNNTAMFWRIFMR